MCLAASRGCLFKTVCIITFLKVNFADLLLALTRQPFTILSPEQLYNFGEVSSVSRSPHTQQNIFRDPTASVSQRRRRKSVPTSEGRKCSSTKSFSRLIAGRNWCCLNTCISCFSE